MLRVRALALEPVGLAKEEKSGARLTSKVAEPGRAAQPHGARPFQVDPEGRRRVTTPARPFWTSARNAF